MSESKGPYKIVTTFAYPSGPSYVVRGPGLDKFDIFTSCEDAERECLRFNAAYAAGVASAEARMNSNMQAVIDALAEAGHIIDQHRSPARSQEKILTEALLDTVSKFKEARDQRDANAAQAKQHRREIERLRAEVYHTAPNQLEFGAEGWTWRQQARANEDRLRELEAEVARLGGVVAAAVQAEQVAIERAKVLALVLQEWVDFYDGLIATHEINQDHTLALMVKQQHGGRAERSRAALNPAPPPKEPNNG